jgi:UDP-N-acetylmuramyl tripeptide synthase
MLGTGEGAVVRVPLAGVYNAYNALAAIAAAGALGIGLDVAARAIAAFRPAFGRLERVDADGRDLRLVLVKNPAGFNAAVGALIANPGSVRLLAALNDLDADGRDVSWIWDADFEALAPRVEWAVVTGLRARDLALRFKYAGLPPERMEVVEGWDDAVRNVLRRTRPGDHVTLLATYTATLALRHTLARLGYAKEFWED